MKPNVSRTDHASPPTTARRWCPAGWGMLASLGAVLFTANATAARPEQLPLQYTPYVIDVYITAENPADLNESAANVLRQRVTDSARSYLGAAWTMHARSAPPALEGELLARLEELTPERLVELTIESTADESRRTHKAMYVVLKGERTGWSIAVRELDFRTYHLSPVIERQRVPRWRLAEGVLQATVAAFSPVAQIGVAEGARIEGQVQAAGLVVNADSPVLVQQGEPLTPIIRRNDRLGRATPDDVLALPWTVLETLSLDGAKLQCRIHSAHHNPLGMRSRLRLQRFAQATRYPSRQTRLNLQTPGDDPSPLVGYEIVRFDDERLSVVARTDAAGSARLPPADERWRKLYVRHGDRLLARLPIVTGWSDDYTVEMPSDDIRLAAEGFVSALRQELIDTVARRRILAARIRRRIAAGQFDEAEDLLADFRTLATARDFARRLDQAQSELVADNARAQQLIDQMFSETRGVLQRYLDPDEAEALATQIARAKAEG